DGPFLEGEVRHLARRHERLEVAVGQVRRVRGEQEVLDEQHDQERERDKPDRELLLALLHRSLLRLEGPRLAAGRVTRAALGHPPRRKPLGPDQRIRAGSSLAEGIGDPLTYRAAMAGARSAPDAGRGDYRTPMRAKPLAQTPPT